MASSRTPSVLSGKTVLASATCAFSTCVKHAFSYAVGCPKWSVRVTSVVPSRY